MKKGLKYAIAASLGLVGAVAMVTPGQAAEAGECDVPSDACAKPIMASPYPEKYCCGIDSKGRCYEIHRARTVCMKAGPGGPEMYGGYTYQKDVFGPEYSSCGGGTCFID